MARIIWYLIFSSFFLRQCVLLTTMCGFCNLGRCFERKRAFCADHRIFRHFPQVLYLLPNSRFPFLICSFLLANQHAADHRFGFPSIIATAAFFLYTTISGCMGLVWFRFSPVSFHILEPYIPVRQFLPFTFSISGHSPFLKSCRKRLISTEHQNPHGNWFMPFH